MYVDDDEDDQQFFSSALHHASPETEIVQARNGMEALNYLSAVAQPPCLIVLDLNMPVLDGRETFERIRRNPALQAIPTVIFTSCMNPNDEAMFQSLGAAFISKPNDFSDLAGIANRMLGLCA